MATQIGELGVTFPDATVQTTAAIAGAPGFGGFTRMSVYTTNSFWVVPAGVTTCKVTVIAGGGSGSPFVANSVQDPPSYYGGSGGASGGAAIKIITGLTPGTSISVTVGAGGVCTDVPNLGGTSSFGAYCSATSGGIGIGGNLNVRATGGTSGGGGNSGYVAYFTGTGGPSILGSYGSGGGGGGYYDAGGSGSAGVVIVEY